jgi:predicted dehydrogenase
MKRRSFIRTGSLAGVGGYFTLTSHSAFSFRGTPNEKIVVGVMGTNSRGWFLAKMFSELPNVEVGYICDVDENVMNKTINDLEKATGKRPKGIKDVRKLLEQKDLDALIIAAPDHWHAPASIMACQAGKHVYVEKPCCHNPYEGEMLINAAVKYNRLVQMGNQRRSFPTVQQAMKDLKDGIIGRVYFAKGWYASNRKPIGVGKLVQVPNTIDYELWQGPAPRMPFKDNLIHYNWHWFWHWGTGESLNNGTHEIDIMRWALNVDYPKTVSSTGGRYHYNDDWETPDTQIINWEFPDNKAMSWEGRSCNGFPIEGFYRGVIVYGEKGTMVYPGADDYKFYDLDRKLIKDVKAEVASDATNTVSPFEMLDPLHLINFVEAIRGNSKLTAPIDEAYISTLLPMLGNISLRTGKTLHCNPLNGKINDKEANKYWRRSYEKGWEIKV